MEAHVQTISTEKGRGPQFTVIIPCWNAARTLKQTLDSLQGQTFKNWEAYVVDDGSSDETSDIVKAISRDDSRIHGISTNRRGPAAARNFAALHKARGAHLAFLDADDVWQPRKLELSFAKLSSEPELAGIYGKISFFRNDVADPETYSTVYNQTLRPLDFLRDNPVCTMSNLVVRRDTFCFFNGFDETMVHNEDIEFLVRMSAGGAKIKGIDEHLVCYRTSFAGLSSNLEMMRQSWERALLSLQSSAVPASTNEVQAARAGNLRYLARRALRTGAPGIEAWNLAIRGVIASPSSFFTPVRRGLMTLMCAAVGVLLPRNLRTAAFGHKLS
jgi:glycosyltransferase involved in cell wall biosynthesis